MNKMKIVKEYYEIKLVLEHLQSLEKTEKRLKRINSKIEDMEELKNEYNELYPKTGIGIPFESALEEYELFEKQKDFTINKSEEGRMYYLQVRRKFEGKTKKEYNYYINQLYYCSKSTRIHHPSRNYDFYSHFQTLFQTKLRYLRIFRAENSYL